MDLSYSLMTSLTIIIVCVAFLLRKQRTIIAKIGFICWISLSAYFIIDYIVIRATLFPTMRLNSPAAEKGLTTALKSN